MHLHLERGRATVFNNTDFHGVLLLFSVLQVFLDDRYTESGLEEPTHARGFRILELC